MVLVPITLLAAHPIVHVNASLNAVATALLLVGLYLIKNGRVEAHKRTMLTAFAVSVVFLACYLWYHNQEGHVEFTHPGAVRYVYYTILATHVPLAMTVPVLAVCQIYLGFRALGCCPPRGTSGRAANCRGSLSRQAHPPGAVDVSDLALCFGYGRDGLRDALSPLAACRGIT